MPEWWSARQSRAIQCIIGRLYPTARLLQTVYLSNGPQQVRRALRDGKAQRHERLRLPCEWPRDMDNSAILFPRSRRQRRSPSDVPPTLQNSPTPFFFFGFMQPCNSAETFAPAGSRAPMAQVYTDTSTRDFCEPLEPVRCVSSCFTVVGEDPLSGSRPRPRVGKSCVFAPHQSSTTASQGLACYGLCDWCFDEAAATSPGCSGMDCFTPRQILQEHADASGSLADLNLAKNRAQFPCGRNERSRIQGEARLAA